jgi:hypothetical protein
VNRHPHARRSRPRRRGSHAPVRPQNLRRLLAGLTAVITGAIGVMITPAAALAASSGTLSLSPGRSASTTVTNSSLGDVAGSAQFTVPSRRTVYLAMQFRASSSGDGYRTRARVLSDGTVQVSFSRVSSGSETLLGGQDIGLKVTTGQKLNLEGMVTGTNPVKLSVRAWADGSSRPGWQRTYSDSSGSRITAAKPVRIWSYLSGSAGGSTSVSFANATASTVSTGGDSSTPGTSKPSASTTGVPSGISLKRHDGDITVTKAGTVLDGLDIHGFVTIKAPNVTIKNSIVRGGWSPGHAIGLITNYGYDNLVIDHVDVVAEHPSVYFDGIKGWDFTAKYVHVVGNVDSVKIHGDNVSVQNSLLEDTTYYSSDPQQGGKPTHNDNIQILSGKNISITGNTARGATNFAVLGGAEQSNVTLVVDRNWLDGGHCTVKLQVRNGWSETARVTNNKFGPHRAVASCPFTAYPAVNLTQYGNVMEQTGAVVNPLILVS